MTLFIINGVNGLSYKSKGLLLHETTIIGENTDSDFSLCKRINKFDIDSTYDLEIIGSNNIKSNSNSGCCSSGWRWIHNGASHDTNEAYYSIALEDAGTAGVACALNLSDDIGNVISKVSFCEFGCDNTEGLNCRAKIYIGDYSNPSGSALIDIPFTTNGFLGYRDLDVPDIPITYPSIYWIVIEIDQTAGEQCVVSVDSGPMVYGGGYLEANYCGWSTTASEGLDFNTLIEVYVETVEYMIPVITSPVNGAIVTDKVIIEATQLNWGMDHSDINYALFEYSSDGFEWTAIGQVTDFYQGGFMDYSSNFWYVVWDTTAIASGKYYIRLTMEHYLGYTDTHEIEVFVNKPPVGKAYASHDEDTMIVTFDGSNSYDIEGGVIQWIWDFGDGATGSGKFVQHFYENTDTTYRVILSVIDDTNIYNTSYYLFNYNDTPNLNIDFCNCQLKICSLALRHQGQALGADATPGALDWPQNPTQNFMNGVQQRNPAAANGLKPFVWDGKTLGPVGDTRFAFEIVAEVIGDPACLQCQGQEIRKTEVIWGVDVSNTNFPYNGQVYGPDNYQKTSDYKKHVGNKVIWGDSPGWFPGWNPNRGCLYTPANDPQGFPQPNANRNYGKRAFRVWIIGSDHKGEELRFEIEWAYNPGGPGHQPPRVVPGSVRKTPITKHPVEVSVRPQGIAVDPMTVTAPVGQHTIGWHWNAVYMTPMPHEMEIVFPANNNPFCFQEEYRVRIKRCETLLSPLLRHAGLFKYTINLYDINGNLIGSLDPWIEVSADADSPNLIINKPTNGLYVSDIKFLPLPFTLIFFGITVEADASDDGSGVEMVEFYINDVLKCDTYNEPYSWHWDESALGFYAIEVVAYDYAGNKIKKEQNVLMFNP